MSPGLVWSRHARRGRRAGLPGPEASCPPSRAGNPRSRERSRRGPEWRLMSVPAPNMAQGRRHRWSDRDSWAIAERSHCPVARHVRGATPQRARRRCSGLSGPRHAVADAELGHDVDGAQRIVRPAGGLTTNAEEANDVADGTLRASPGRVVRARPSQRAPAHRHGPRAVRTADGHAFLAVMGPLPHARGGGPPVEFGYSRVSVYPEASATCPTGPISIATSDSPPNCRCAIQWRVPTSSGRSDRVPWSAPSRAEPATGRRSSMRPRKPGRSTSTTSRTSILRSTSETKGGTRSAACRATGIGVVPEVRGA